MGTWGTRIYEDDTALDVRHRFLSYISTLPSEQRTRQETIAEIEQVIYGEFKGDDADTVTLALCCVELEKGLLTEETKRNTLEVIGSGRDIARWDDAASEDFAKRKDELTLIRKYIEDYDGRPVMRKSWIELQKSD